MGQYWRIVNLDKKEKLNAFGLNSGLKLWEQLANNGPGQALGLLLNASGRAMILLQAACPEHRGGGDLEMDKNLKGIDRYAEIAQRTIGRWVGDRVILVGDYSEPEDYPALGNLEKIYEESSDWKDITSDVITVLNAELQ